MAGIETDGGKCPICGKGMVQKWESSDCGYIFDACPFCGYVNSNTEELKSFDEFENQCENTNEVKDKKELLKENIIHDWNSILSHYDCNSRDELIKKCNIKESYTEEESEFYPTLWGVKEDELKAIAEAVEELKKDNLI